MSETNILESLQTIFRNCFKDEGLTIDRTTSNEDIDAWDSLNHAVLIDAIEKANGFKFDLMEMLSIENVGDICDIIKAKNNK